jgi:hypothetical protein
VSGWTLGCLSYWTCLSLTHTHTHALSYVRFGDTKQYEELSESITDVVFIKIDVDENPDTAAKVRVDCVG